MIKAIVRPAHIEIDMIVSIFQKKPHVNATARNTHNPFSSNVISSNESRYESDNPKHYSCDPHIDVDKYTENEKEEKNI